MRMLCQICSSIFQRPRGYHHTTLSSLQNAAKNGCFICEPLLHHALSVSGSLPNCLIKPYEYEVEHGVYALTSGSRVVIYMRLRRDGVLSEKRVQFRVVPCGNLTAVFGVREKNTRVSDVAIQVVKGWLGKCVDGHKRCQGNTRPSSYPTRLLELGESTVRLILTDKEKISTSYAALSYCWGPNPTFLRLTASNIQDLHNGIPIADLPLAFQEAITILKQLSIKYLWIDALCIIQSGPGSTEDWRTESAKMQAVYSNCILNISLATAANPAQSCLSSCPSTITRPFPVHLEQTDYTVIPYSYYHETLYAQPLGSRAWVLQERLLSPRVLSLGMGEFFWDCVQVPNASESFPAGLGHLSHTFSLADKAIPGTSKIGELQSAWWRILREYTMRQLTFPDSDKLVALSAIATRMADAMKDTYIAGHFRKTLPQSLNWKVQRLIKKEDNGQLPRRIIQSGKHGKTPSWSWASMDGLLDVEPNNSKSLAEIEGYTVTPVEETNPTGQIASATLTIKAHVVEIEWKGTTPEIMSDTPKTRDWRYVLSINIDDPKDQPEHESKSWIVVLNKNENLAQCEGLVLRQEEGMYIRIGHFVHFCADSFKFYWRDDFDRLFGVERKVITLA